MTQAVSISASNERLRSVDELLAQSGARLVDHSGSPRTDAALLLAHVLGRGREWIVAHGDVVPSAGQVEALRRLCERRAAGVPLPYLLGTAHFYGREFIVNESVLVPRPETEHLVDEALGFIRGPMRVLDVGTGCGAIACTIAAETEACVAATDISRAAIDTASENACRLGVADRCRFYYGDLAEPLCDRRRFDVVIANLPYIPTADLPQLPDPASYEPRAALDGGPDGLAMYRRVLAQVPRLLNERALILLEAAPPTISSLAALVRSALPNFVVEGRKDYAGMPRYIKAFEKPSMGLRGAAAGECAGEPLVAGAADTPSVNRTPRVALEERLPPCSR